MKTIRQSEFKKILVDAKMEFANTSSFLDLLEKLGVQVVPDPEPMKVEFECYWNTEPSGIIRPYSADRDLTDPNPHLLLKPFAEKRVKTRIIVEEIL